MTSTILSENRLPVPSFQVFPRHECDSANEYFLAHNKDVVVEPSTGTSHGSEISITLKSRLTFVRGFAKALCFSNSVMVEEFVEGGSFRNQYRQMV